MGTFPEQMLLERQVDLLQVKEGRKSLSGRGNIICKAPEVEKSLKSGEKSKKTGVSGT